jgi:GT2 family glycosyltransferase
MPGALFGLPLDKLTGASSALVRARALVTRRRRARPAWPDPLQADCARIVHGRPEAAGRIWVLAAHQRHDLVRCHLAELGGHASVERPALIIVACDPAARHELAARAGDWANIFGVAFELLLPDVPVAPAHLIDFCGRLSASAEVLLSPAEALFERDGTGSCHLRAFRALASGALPVRCWSAGDPSLSPADRVPVAVWGRGAAELGGGVAALAGPAPPPSCAEPQWAPMASIRLPAVPMQGGRYAVLRRLYRHQGLLLAIAARLLPIGLAGGTYQFAISRCCFIPGCGWFIAGAIADPCRVISRVGILPPGGGPELDISAYWHRVPHPQLDRVHGQFALPEPPRGFVAFLPPRSLGAESSAESSPEALTLCLHPGGRKREVQTPVQRLAPGIAALRRLLDGLSPDPVRLASLMSRQLAPPLHALWTGRDEHGLDRRADLAQAVQRFGAPPERPRVSVVIPLYGRWDFMRYQLAQFAHDPTLRDVEWIYVLDDPRLADAVLPAVDALHRVFGLPLALVYCGENLGFSGACNLGARVARGELLLLLNSDVVPLADGWLEPMVAALGGHEVGAVGARLLYEDHAVQHAGMAFEPFAPWPGLRIAVHPGKGFPDALLPAAGAALQGVTAACLLMRRREYAALGGLWDGFAVADFEDADLCVRITASGKRIVLAPGARLYHLERQSIATGDQAGAPGGWRDTLTLYNCWLFNRRLAQRP